LLWQDGNLAAAEEQTLTENLYFGNEVQLMLATVDWADVTVYRGYTGALATADDTMLVFVARKAG
jgi:hypothetical protein